MELYENAFLLLCMAASFFYGILVFFKPKKALYLKMITCAIGCMMLGRLYQTLYILVDQDKASNLNLGILGILGGFLFFFIANYGEMDSLIDDGSKRLTKYRILSMIAPIGIIIESIPFVFGKESILKKCFVIVVVLVIIQTSYYCLKAVVIPDVEGGIIRSLRIYNTLVIVLAFFETAELTLCAYCPEIVKIMIYFLIGCTTICIMPALYKGEQKWTI